MLRLSTAGGSWAAWLCPRSTVPSMSPTGYKASEGSREGGEYVLVPREEPVVQNRKPITL